MGIFDDLIPAAAASTNGGGLFDDLIPTGPKIDFGRPAEEVRADIAKIPAGPQRDQIMRQWADAYVAKEREGVKRLDVPLVGNPLRLGDTVRNLARGTIVGSVADELNAGTNAALHKVTGERFGAPYDESVEYQRALDRALDKESPIGSTVEKVVGGVATAAPVAKAAFKAAKGAVAKSGVGGLLGGAYSYLTGLGDAEGDIYERNDKAIEKVPLGTVVGTFLPPAIAGTMHAGGKVNEALSPVVARVGATISDLPRRISPFPAMSASKAPESAGANAAADQILANQLIREGKSVDDVRKELDKIDQARRFNSNSNAQNATGLVDLTSGWQREAGSVVRASPEADNIAKTFFGARQTGLTPVGSEAADVASMGLPTRARMARPLTGAQAEKTLGSRFGTPEDKIVPMGQGERLEDAYRRALLIEDEASHGHGANAFRTVKQIADRQKEEAAPAYEAFHRAGDNVDIRPALEPVMTAWLKGDKMAKEAEPVQALVRRVAALFAPKGNLISNAEQFDKTKQYADGVIDKFFKSPDGGNRRVGKVLSDFKNDLLKAMDDIQTNDLGKNYKEARSNFSSHAEAMEDIELGLRVWKDNSDVGVDAINALVDAGRGKGARLGLWEGYRLAASRMKRGADKTTLLDNPRIQDIMEAAIPRSKEAGAEFANRPERFGRYIENEIRMAESPKIVRGGSPTQRNKVDDDAHNAMSRFSETLEQFKGSPNVVMLGVRAVEQMLNKLFGMRADTAAAIARKLFTANRADIERTLQAVETRLGRDRFGHFQRLMNEYYTTTIATRQIAMPEAAE